MIEGGDWDKVGRCGIWNNEISPCIHQNHIFRLRFYGRISNRWSEMYLNSPVGRKYFESFSKQTTNLASINKTQLTNLLFPLPQLAEQQRIVTKVQKLQQQLSQLEAQVQQSRQYAQQLLQVILKEAFKQHPKVYDLNQEMSLVAE
jgi:type I restriction enzyme, S subunit